MRTLFALVGAVTVGACATAGVPSVKEGLVEYAGAQRTIFATGKAEGLVPVSAIAVDATSFGVGAAAGLDGEITVFAGKPFVTKVRGNGYTMDHGTGDAAIFAVWTRQAHWTEEPVPANVKGYLDLQRFVKVRAQAAGLDVNRPFPFRLEGSPVEVKWHINVDLSEGKPITSESFAKSKSNYVARNEPMDIIGFYSEKHDGVFTSLYVPAIKKGSGAANAIHIHLVTRDGRSAGHIDDITLGSGMTLRLPKI